MIDVSNHLQIRASGINLKQCRMPHFIALVRAYLERLRVIDERFNRISILGDQGYDPVQTNLVDLEARIDENINRKIRLQRRELLAGDEKGRVHDGINAPEFSITFFSYNDDEKRSHRAINDGGVELLIRSVSREMESSAGLTLTLPDLDCDDSVTRQLARKFIDATLDVWPFNFVSARTLDFETTVAETGDLYSGQWITFMPFPDIGEYLPPPIEWEHVRDGVLVTVTPGIPRSRNASDVAAGKRVREALDNLGLVWHSTYAIHGWPPDEEEWRYEDFISGAPRGRKYRVRCIDFDGYDAQRNVLLYAKLFRRLRRQRKEWGLRGWDGPVLNEARRQVRAANGTPIEWHVGLEEPAARVRTLLADYTKFTDAQLRVIYTPVSQALAR